MLELVELRILQPLQQDLRSLPLGRIERAVNAVPAVITPATAGVVFGASGTLTAPTTRFKLVRPARRRLPDSFYKDVAEAYRQAVAAGLNPRKTLATDSGAPADTVARWTLEARKRGYLPATEPGKVSA
jgi:hypothetical protein